MHYIKIYTHGLKNKTQHVLLEVIIETLSKRLLELNRFGIPFQSDNNQWYTRKITLQELLRIYSIKVDATMVFPPNFEHVIDSLLPHCLPWTFRRNLMQNNIYMTNILESFVNRDTM